MTWTGRAGGCSAAVVDCALIEFDSEGRKSIASPPFASFPPFISHRAQDIFQPLSFAFEPSDTASDRNQQQRASYAHLSVLATFASRANFLSPSFSSLRRLTVTASEDCYNATDDTGSAVIQQSLETSLVSHSDSHLILSLSSLACYPREVLSGDFAKGTPRESPVIKCTPGAEMLRLTENVHCEGG